jgi:hypothetical protein
MFCLTKSTKLIAFIFFLLVGLFVAGNGFAEDSAEANPLRFYKGENGTYLKGTFRGEMAYFNQKDSWFGESRQNLGDHSGIWWEGVIRPGIEGSYFSDAVGEVYGRTDAVFAATDGTDAANSNDGNGDISDMRMEDAYIGWRSGNLFSSLGKNFLDISFGRQQYVAGNGFLFYSESSNGDRRGAYWTGERKAAQYAGIARVKTGGFSTELLYLRADDAPNTNTKASGVTLDYTFEKAGNVGGGFYYIDSNLDSRDSMKVYDARFSLHPFAFFDGLSVLQPFKLEAEYVYENTDDNNTSNGNGWYISAGYQFDVPWKPSLTYRYASFDEDYDPLFYGFYDWGYWYQGEILGEYVLSNSNLDSHMVQLNVKPIDTISINLFYYHFELHDASDFGVDSSNYADEYDLTVDWNPNDHLSFSVVGAYADPNNGAKEQTGGNDNWAYMMLWGSVEF